MNDSTGRVEAKTPAVWAVVLAGGEGMRLRPLTHEVFGDDRPKQYASLVGEDSLLRQTLDRTERLVPIERTVVVSQERHARWLAREFRTGRPPTVLLQPENRDTAAGVLLPVYWVAAQDPGAVVAIFPSDHFVLERTAFLAHVAEVVAFVEHHPEWIVLLGACATDADPEYGWIEPGEPVGSTTAGPIARVARFREKPTREAAAGCLMQGWLWNTFVFVSRARTLVSVAEELLPELHDRLTAAIPFIGTPHEASALRRAYANLPRRNFSEVVLQAGLRFLAVSTLPPLTWSDLGTPERLFKLLRALRLAPAWLRGRRTGRVPVCRVG